MKLLSEFKSLREKIWSHITAFRSERVHSKDQDIENIIHSSKLLHISEFRLFQIAYSRWYGRDTNENTVEPFFSDYIMEERIPHWVRHLTREIQCKYFEGCLDPREYNSEHPLVSYRWQGRVAFLPVFLTFAYIIFYLLLTGQIRVP